jgi:hypothetical protein
MILEILGILAVAGAISGALSPSGKKDNNDKNNGDDRKISNTMSSDKIEKLDKIFSNGKRKF